jgi:tetratricopeptide (TPR) repeat protein
MSPAWCFDVLRLETLTNGISVSRTALDAWRRIIAAVGLDWRPHPGRESDPDLSYLRTAGRLRTDPPEAAERQLAELLETHPTSFQALEQHAWILDRMGQRDAALAQYDSARRGRQLLGRGMPDRPFFMRHRTTSVAEIDGYTRVLRAGASKKGILAHLARGHAYLATGRPRLALLDYDAALKLAPQETGILVASGEALAALGRHREALAALDSAAANRPRDPEALGSRACVLLALDRLADANADWSRQLALLPRERHDARACVALRMANYQVALDQLEQALVTKPGDAYLHLYYLTALRRLGRSIRPGSAVMDAWPGPLIVLHHGELGADEVLQRADTPERRAEALFQLGIRACDQDAAEAGRLWRQAAELAAPDTIEHAAARHEIERLGAVVQAIGGARATNKETMIMAMSK